ncbi:MAG TPA: tyrosine--tRNA ligase [Oligoflexia bacterium]|nr:tyrosine--tRNA ligase [Oligoflexia bacterium]HMR25687.1 tyrosine--tRNA ligase [Oligoflexia bacterium]
MKEALELLSRGTVEILPKDGLEKKLNLAKKENRPLRVKAGFDPTAPDIHLGHTVLLQKMRQFQQLGHEVVFLIGDFTARIGDPTGRSKLRPALSEQDIQDNSKTYKEQVFKVLDADKTKIKFNSEWLDELSAAQLIEITTHYSVARMLERDDFAKRFKAEQSISIREFMYPLLQGYDSVALKADIELGGNDQKFNLLMGRELQKVYDQDPQVIMTVPLLEGTDGVQKMSKSYDNYIGVNENPKDMFGKLMSISDELMFRYYELLSDIGTSDLEKLKKDIQNSKVHPKQAKINFAKEVLARFYSKEQAEQEAVNFDNQFKQGDIPDDIPSIVISEHKGKALADILCLANIVASKSEARRLSQQNAVKLIEAGKNINEAKILSDANASPDLNAGDVIKVGKRKWLKLN